MIVGKTLAATSSVIGCCVVAVVCAGSADASGSIQRPVRVHFRPQSITRPRYLTTQPILVNETSHPALHNFTTDNRECAASPGMTCAILALAGSAGIGSWHVCVDLILSPFGSCTDIGVIASMTSFAGAVAKRKWLVAPESKIAQSLISSSWKSIVSRRACAAYPYLVGG